MKKWLLKNSNMNPIHENSVKIKQALLEISGRVQGVFYRAHAQNEAQKLRLTGYAKNMPGGSVEILLQGPESQINAFIEWAREGSPSAKVDKVEVKWQTPVENFKNFEIF